MIRLLTRSVATLLLALPAFLSAQRPPEVRQLVTFLFRPGLADSASAIYERELIPLYRADSAMRRFRAYLEAESPEPMDLVVVSSFDGMAGMDASNAALRMLSSGGRSTFAWYGVLAGLSMHHHDQFVEMLPALGDGDAAGADTAAGLVAMEWVQVAAGRRDDYERLLRERVRPLEREQRIARWTETGRVLVGDRWDYVRFIGAASLGEWARYHAALRERGAAGALEPLVVARKVVLVRRVPRLSVR